MHEPVGEGATFLEADEDAEAVDGGADDDDGGVEGRRLNGVVVPQVASEQDPWEGGPVGEWGGRMKIAG